MGTAQPQSGRKIRMARRYACMLMAVLSCLAAGPAEDVSTVREWLTVPPGRAWPSERLRTTTLHIACQGGQFDVARKMLERGADVNARDERERTPLHLAIEAEVRGDGPPVPAEQVEFVRLLLEHGARTDVRDDRGRTPLRIAMARGASALEIGRALLEHGADPNGIHAGPRRAMPSLSEIFSGEHDRLGRADAAWIALLADAGADLDAEDAEAGPPLHMAARQLWAGEDTLKALLEAGADPQQLDADGMAPLHYTAQKLKKTKTELLLEHGADAGVRNAGGRTPLHYAAREGATRLALWEQPLETAALLLEHGADPNARDDLGRSPLDEALLTIGATGLDLKRKLDKVDEVPEEDVGALADWLSADEQLDDRMAGAMMAAMLTGMGEALAKEADVLVLRVDDESQRPRPMVELLLQNGAGPHLPALCYVGDVEQAKALADAEPQLVDTVGSSGHTPLYAAVCGGSVELARMLLDRGADPEGKTKFGEAPLHAAANRGGVAMIKLLLERGADPSPRNSLNWTPLHRAAANADLGLATLLLDSGADADAAGLRKITPLRIAVERADASEVVKLLLQRGADPSAVAESGSTIFHEAANAEIVKVLLENGADPNQRDESGDAPLHDRNLWQKQGFVAALLAGGADPNLPGLGGSTPLHIAVSVGNEPMAELLLRHGANVNARTIRGTTPLHMAAGGAWSSIRLVRLLLVAGADLNAADEDGETPLDAALAYGRSDVVALLRNAARQPR